MNRFDRPRQLLAISVAALAGFVDAIGFLSADGYFVSFMSGNTTRLGVDLAHDWRGAALPGLLIAGFVTGVACGHIVALRAGDRRKAAVLALVSALLALAALASRAGLVTPTLAALVLAMGAINNTFQRGETPVGLTYMTGTLVRIGQGIGAQLAGERRSGWGVYGLLWLGLACGGVAGALAFLQMGSVALWIAAAAAAAMALTASRLRSS